MAVNTKDLEQLAREIEDFKRASIGQLVERGAEIMREEVPKITHRLESGVSSTVDYEDLTGEIIVSARSDRRGARTATLHLESGATKSVKLRPTNPYNYAEVVALGNKVGEGNMMTPKKAKAFLIPVSSAPENGDYITDGDQIYIVRRTRKGRKPNPYHERTATRLNNEASGIVSALSQEFFQ